MAILSAIENIITKLIMGVFFLICMAIVCGIGYGLFILYTSLIKDVSEWLDLSLIVSHLVFWGAFLTLYIIGCFASVLFDYVESKIKGVIDHE